MSIASKTADSLFTFSVGHDPLLKAHKIALQFCELVNSAGAFFAERKLFSALIAIREKICYTGMVNVKTRLEETG